MPRGDRRGPDGRGPMTGRRAGYCAGHDVPGYANDSVPPMGGGRGSGRGGGRGWGRGRGGGRGWGRGRPGPYPDPYYEPVPVQAPVAPQDEASYLEGAAERLEADLKAIKDRIKELRKSKKE